MFAAGGVMVLSMLLCLVVPVVVCLAFVIPAQRASSRPAQRQHDREYAPAQNVYVVLHTENTYNSYTTDNRQVHIHAGELAAPAEGGRIAQRPALLTPAPPVVGTGEPGRRFRAVGFND